MRQVAISVVFVWLVFWGVVINFLFVLCLFGYKVELAAPDSWFYFLQSIGFGVKYIGG